MISHKARNASGFRLIFPLRFLQAPSPQRAISGCSLGFSENMLSASNTGFGQCPKQRLFLSKSSNVRSL
jgi:hypothetical protein